MLRSSKHNISSITNKKKLASLDQFFIDYKLCLEYYIDLIIKGELPLKKFVTCKNLPSFNITHSRYKQLIYKHASEIIRSQLKKTSERRYKVYRKVYSYFHKEQRQLKFLELRFKDLQLKDLMKTRFFTKPSLKTISITLDERFFDIKQGVHFDNFLKIILPWFNEKGTRGLQVKLPLKHHKHSNKLLQSNFKLRKCIQLKQIDGKIFVNLIYQKEPIPLKQEGTKLGIDIGYKKLIVSSDKQYIGREMEQIYKSISRKKQGSKNFKQSLVHRDNMINFYCNQLSLTNINHLVIEDLKDVKHKSNFSKKFNNKLQRWSYPLVITKLTRICEDKGIYMEKVSPSYTSQTCSCCSHVDKNSRQGEKFICTSCEYEIDSDYNGSINICNRGVYSLSNQRSEIIKEEISY